MKSAHEHAGISIRALAVLLDWLILLPISHLFASLTLDSANMQVLLSLFIPGAYYVIFVSGSWQATPGKRVTGIYITNQDGSQLDAKQALQRYLAYSMPIFPLLTSFEFNTSSVISMWLHIVWFFPVAITINKTGIHDMLCHTYVVHGKAEESKL